MEKGHEQELAAAAKRRRDAKKELEEYERWEQEEKQAKAKGSFLLGLILPFLLGSLILFWLHYTGRISF